MVKIQYIAAFVSVAAVACASAVKDEWHLTLLKRQAPGTPAYDCHSNCGTAITLSRGSDLCTNSTFVDDYNACLACAGPDNQNIWQYYGGTLTTAASKCGLPTTPLSKGASSNSTASASGAPSTSTTAPSSPASTSTSTSSPTAPTTSSSTGSPTSTVSGNSTAATVSASGAGAISTLHDTFTGSVVIFAAFVLAASL